MLAASEQPSSEQPLSEQGRFALPRRTVAILVTLLVHALLLFLLLTLTPARQFIPMGRGRLISIATASEQDQASRARSPTKTKAAKAKSEPAPAAAAPPPVPPPVPTKSVPDYPLIRLSHDEMVGLDATMRAHNAQQSANAGDTGPPDTDKAGTGPKGQPLYAAEWYREPTDTELNFYLPKDRAITGYGTVACRTVVRFHVEDCEEIDESPRGSGLSRAVREAAWQFLIRPPRVGGRSLVGEWVRIRITWTERGAAPAEQ